ncbi:MAG: 50S ribosomal protein L25/general stress protein Ctc, partial [Proteobacteria bacterium]|nr:50S ribosomal protein L25/general stress protein Ctc [Pseudomonadota bacterium]
VIYGLGKDPVSVTLPFNAVLKKIKNGRFTSTLFDLHIGDDSERVIPKEVQVDVVMDFPIHIDFLRLDRNTKVSVDVAVHFINEDTAPGIKRGGVLNIVRHEVELLCPSEAIPEFIEANLDGLDIGDSVHISNIALPEGVEPTIADRDFTIATIAAPSGGTDDDEDATDDEGAEGGEDEAGTESVAEDAGGDGSDD